MRRIDDIEVSRRYLYSGLSKVDLAVRIIIYIAKAGGVKTDAERALYDMALDYLFCYYGGFVSKKEFDSMLTTVADVFNKRVFNKEDIDFFLE